MGFRELRTAGELLDFLRSGEGQEEWLAHKDEIAQRLSRLYRREEEPLVRDLAAAGVRVTSVWDLLNAGPLQPAAIAVLIRHLGRPDYCDRTKEGIARALIVREAKGKADLALVEEYRRTDAARYGEYKRVLGYAIACVAQMLPVSLCEELLAPAHGAGRKEIVQAILRIHRRDAPAILQAILRRGDTDPELREMVTAALVSLGGRA